jgi:hypothetical protein
MFSAVATLNPDWNPSENAINLFLEGDFAAGRTNKCHLVFKDVAARNEAKMGQIRSQIAKHLAVEDIFLIQLESSSLAAKAKTFKARGTVCDRVNAIWNEFGHDDRKAAKEVFQHVRAPWLRVRKAEYLLITLPEKKGELCITPSVIATVGNVRELIAEIGEYSLPRSLRLQIGDYELTENDNEGLQTALRPYKGASHKAVITCTQELHECSICAEEVGYLEWPGINSILCKHDGTSCRPCLQNWIAAALDENNVERITCPECEVGMDYNDLKRHASEEEFAR